MEGHREQAWRIATAPLEERVVAIEEILIRLSKLEEEVEDLRAKAGQDSTNSSRPPSSDGPRGQSKGKAKRKPPSAPTGRKRGGQQGHPKHSRPLTPPEKVAAVVDCKPRSCGDCGAPLHGDDATPVRHQVAEIPPIEPVVTEYRLHECVCDRCGARTRGGLPKGVPTGSFGPRLTAILALLSGGCRLGKRTVQQLADQLFGLTISLGMICKLERRVAEALEQPIAHLGEYVRTQPVNIDETSWREHKSKSWLWVVVAPLATFFHIADRRTGQVAKSLLGEAYDQVATSDRHGAYNWIKHRQLCWSHLRRDFQAMVDRGGAGQPIGERLLSMSDALFIWWHRVRDGDLARSSFRTYVSILRGELTDALEAGMQCGCAKTARICKRLLKEEAHLWTFARLEGIEPTNNTGERAINVAVRYRKMSGGTDSEAGSRFVERVLSVVATCRQQGRDVLEYLTECLQAKLHQLEPPSLVPSREH
ncbi:IS66 family transposase [Kolteria novifilia]|uniref:IS66 family transposase n=1 Tax=Kolteria novifilia TaxID=2527975 RepID=UPI003AF3D5A0